MSTPTKIASTRMKIELGMAWATATAECTLVISTISNPHCSPDEEGNPQYFETKAFLGRDDFLTRYAVTREQALAGHRAMFLEVMSVFGTSSTFTEAVKRLKSIENS